MISSSTIFTREEDGSVGLNVAIRVLDINDCFSVARIHTLAFPESSLTRLGIEAVRRYYAQQMVETNDCLAMGAFQEDGMAGFIYAGIFHGVLNDFLYKNRLFLTGRVLAHPWLVFDPMFRDALRLALQKLKKRHAAVQPQKDPGVKARPFVVLSIAVDPRVQKSGIGQMLMRYAEKEALDRGFQWMSLTVNQDNCAAIRFYEKNGWQKRPGAASRNLEMIKLLNP